MQKRNKLKVQTRDVNLHRPSEKRERPISVHKETVVRKFTHKCGSFRWSNKHSTILLLAKEGREMLRFVLFAALALSGKKNSIFALEVGKVQVLHIEPSTNHHRPFHNETQQQQKISRVVEKCHTKSLRSRDMRGTEKLEIQNWKKVFLSLALCASPLAYPMMIMMMSSTHGSLCTMM